MEITFEPSESRLVYCTIAIIRSDLADCAVFFLKTNIGEEYLTRVSLEQGLHNLKKGIPI